MPNNVCQYPYLRPFAQRLLNKSSLEAWLLYPFHPDLSLQNIHWKANFDLNSSIFQPYQAILSQSEGIRNPAEE